MMEFEELDFPLFVVAGIFLLTIITVLKGAKIVPQGEEWVVERLGRFKGVLKPGFSLIVPYVDSVAYKVITKEQILDIPSQEVITKDNGVVTINAVTFFKVIDPARSAYGVTDLNLAIRQLILTSLRAIVGKLELDEALASRNKINAELRDAVSGATDTWGTVITRVEIKDITPPSEIAAAMARQIKADRDRRATILQAEGTKQAAILTAEGTKQAAILEAEGRKEAAMRDGEARERLAKAESRAIEMVGETIQKAGELSAVFLLGEKYVKAVKAMGESDNAKLVLLPADIIKTVKSIFQKQST
jgi:regulator of protease activity HflC (stomatin/prohibitin superfamily)